MNWMILPYRRYFDFTGRSRRKEYWLFVLFYVLVSIVISAIFGTPSYERYDYYVGFATRVSSAGNLVQDAFWLFSIIPGLAVSVRRLHDQDRSGWLLLLALIPFFGWFVLLVLMCLHGTRGRNRFGADPKGPDDEREIFS
jgi:uncharacterized membrane protein YhaH (DUF805 family)